MMEPETVVGSEEQFWHGEFSSARCSCPLACAHREPPSRPSSPAEVALRCRRLTTRLLRCGHRSRRLFGLTWPRSRPHRRRSQVMAGFRRSPSRCVPRRTSPPENRGFGPTTTPGRTWHAGCKEGMLRRHKTDICRQSGTLRAAATAYSTRGFSTPTMTTCGGRSSPPSTRYVPFHRCLFHATPCAPRAALVHRAFGLNTRITGGRATHAAPARRHPALRRPRARGHVRAHEGRGSVCALGGAHQPARGQWRRIAPAAARAGLRNGEDTALAA